MSTLTHEPADSNTISLASSLDLKAASALAQQLLTHRGSDTRLDAGDVQHLGALCLQVLLSAARTWKEDGMQIAVVGASTRFVDDLKQLGADPAEFQIKEFAQ